MAVLPRVGWRSYAEWRPTGKMSHFPLGAHAASCWEGEKPGEKEEEWRAEAHSPGGLVLLTLSNIPTGRGEYSAVNRKIKVQ